MKKIMKLSRFCIFMWHIIFTVLYMVFFMCAYCVTYITLKKFRYV